MNHLRSISEWTLIAAIACAVLSFGGTEPRSFAVVQVLLFGVAMLLIWNRRQGEESLPSGAMWVLRALLGYVLLQLIPLPASFLALVRSATYQPAPGTWATLSIDPHRTVAQLLVLLPACIALLISFAVTARKLRGNRVVYALIVLGMVEAGYGLFQYLTGSKLIFAYENKYAAGRAFGTYINPNHFAGLLEMVLPLILALALIHAGQRRMALESFEERPLEAEGPAETSRVVLYLFLAAVMFVALLFSESRMAILATVTSLVVVGIWAGLGGWSRRTEVMSAGAFIVAAMVLAGYIGVDPLISRFEGIESGATIRAEIWRDTFHLPAAFFWIGSGLGTFPVAYTVAQTTALDLFVNHAHNDYLEFAVELGAPLTLLVFGAVFVLVARLLLFAHSPAPLWPKRMALGVAGGLIALLIHSLADFNLYIPANLMVFCSLVGVGLGILCGEERAG